MTDAVLPSEGRANGNGASASAQAAQRWGAGEGTAGPSPAAMLDGLAASDLLPGLGAPAYGEVVDQLSTRHVGAGACLVAKDDPADSLFVVLEGRVEVVLDTDDGTQQLSEVGAGGVVGEIGLLAGDTRSATVRGLTDCEVVVVPEAAMRQLMASHPGPAEDLVRRATERLRRTQVIAHFTELFGVIDPSALQLIEQLVDWVHLPAGSRLFAEGDEGDAAYLVAAGRLRAYRHTNGVEVEIGEIGRAELVGEMSLIDAEVRSASLFAVRDTQLIRFSRSAYEELLQSYPRVAVEVAHIALRRTRAAAARPGPHRLSVVVVPVSPGLDLRGFVDRLTSAFGPGGRSL
jgi:NTE family protein/lysophospholipid hydrolase